MRSHAGRLVRRRNVHVVQYLTWISYSECVTCEREGVNAGYERLRTNIYVQLPVCALKSE